MSRYLILVILNIPLVITAVFNAFVSYKLGHISRKRLVFKALFWLFLMVVLIFTQPIYNFLYSEGLTKTEALSLFDVVLISGCMQLFFLVNRLYVKVDVVERRLHDFHQETSILLSNIRK